MNNGAVRRGCLKIYDFLKGGEITRFYKEIKQLNEKSEPNKEQLSELLKWSVNNTAYYKNCDFNDIYSFPVLKKNTLCKKADDIIAFNAGNNKLHTVSTSGSTGVPLTVVWNKRKRQHQIAEMIYYYEKAGIKFGQKTLFFRGNPKKKKVIKEWLNNVYEYDVTCIDDNKLGAIVRMLSEDSGITGCLAYGSFNEELLKYIIHNDIHRKFKIKSIITGAEVTTMNCKKGLAALTGVRVYDRYSNSENGFIAQTDNCSSKFKVNVAGFFVEILKMDSDEAAEKGEIGRIVITDLYNYAMPMIRYDTGDMAAYSEKAEGWVTVLEEIQGRQSDIIYNTNGEKITTSSWNAYMDAFPLIRQYQLVQEEKKKYRLTVNCDQNIYKENDIIAAVRKTLGADADIMIEYVEGIPQLSSGKFKKTVCNYTPQEEAD